MRVMCVKKPFGADEESAAAPKPDIGDEDVVIAEKIAFGKLFYKLERFGMSISYAARCFATLPEQTADEMESETKEAIVPCPAY